MTQRRRKLPPLLEAVQRERRHLVVELHEGLCQDLCGVLLQLRLLERRLGREAPAFAADFSAAIKDLDYSVEESRLLFRKLQPAIAGRATLVNSLKLLAHTKNPSVSSILKYRPFAGEIALADAQAAFAIAHEAFRFLLSNPAARTIQLKLLRRGSQFELAVSAPQPAHPLPSERVALLLMKRAAALSQGDLRIHGSANHEYAFIFTGPLIRKTPQIKANEKKRKMKKMG